MKIVFISQWYYPEPDGRVSALAEGLVEKGHEVTVITAFPNYPQGKIYDGYKVSLFQREAINGVNVIRLPIFADHSHSVIKRMLNYLSFFLSLFFLAPWFIKKVDIFWSYTPFVVIPTIWCGLLFRKPYVLEITDIWPDTINETGMINNKKILQGLDRVAQIGYRHAQAITVQNPGFKTTLIARGVSQEKIHVIENWADEEVFYPLPYDNELAEKYGLDGKFNITFAGNMGVAQDLSNIIKAAETCQKYEKIQFVFIGDGVCLSETKQQVQEKKLSNVKFIARKPLQDMAALFAISDVLLVTLADKPIFELTLPSKAQAYMACEKPLLIAKRGDDIKFLKEEGCAVIVEPENFSQLAAAVFQLYSLPVEKRDEMGKKSLSLYKQKYTKNILLKKMEAVFFDVINSQ
ncbi:MAG: colanic acid biosynthesis glycosyl transferase WcaI [Enterobacterales bacterium]|jgi:colanic acid biosynthesis glycosyl transferase WcaI